MTRDVPKKRTNVTWGCPHEENGLCTRVKMLPCNPGMPGCTLHGRFTFSIPEKNPKKKRRDPRT
jgi:hypothetical protein